MRIRRGQLSAEASFGFFVEQRLVTAGKLGKNRDVAEQERLQTETSAQAQKLRVLNSVRILYYEALGAELPGSGSDPLGRALAPCRRDFEGAPQRPGRPSRPDLLESEIEAERAGG